MKEVAEQLSLIVKWVARPIWVLFDSENLAVHSVPKKKEGDLWCFRSFCTHKLSNVLTDQFIQTSEVRMLSIHWISGLIASWLRILRCEYSDHCWIRDSLWWMDLPTTCTYLILMAVTILTSCPRFTQRKNMEIVDWCQFCLVMLFAVYIVMFWLCFCSAWNLIGLKRLFRHYYCSILFPLAMSYVCVCAVIQVLYKQCLFQSISWIVLKLNWLYLLLWKYMSNQIIANHTSHGNIG